jgi:flagellar protein FlaF
MTSADFGRTLEAAALIEAARHLEACAEHPARLPGALCHNLRLWTVLKGELMRPDHEMPMDLRVDLMRLSALVDRQTFEVLAGPELGAEMVRALIDINRTVAGGLAVAAL